MCVQQFTYSCAHTRTSASMCIQISELKVQVNKPFRHTDAYLAAKTSVCLLVDST